VWALSKCHVFRAHSVQFNLLVQRITPICGSSGRHRDWSLVSAAATKPLLNPSTAGKRRTERQELVACAPTYCRHAERQIVRRRLADVDWQAAAMDDTIIISINISVVVGSLVSNVGRWTAWLHATLRLTPYVTVITDVRQFNPTDKDSVWWNTVILFEI